MKNNLVKLVKEYFDVYEKGSTRDLYWRMGKKVSYQTIQDIVDILEKSGLLQKFSVKSTKYCRAHYVYARTYNEKPVMFIFFYAFCRILPLML